MNEEVLTVLKDILFQLHVLTSHNFQAMAMQDGEDDISCKVRETGIRGLEQEKKWMERFLVENGGAQVCPSGNSCSSDS